MPCWALWTDHTHTPQHYRDLGPRYLQRGLHRYTITAREAPSWELLASLQVHPDLSCDLKLVTLKVMNYKVYITIYSNIITLKVTEAQECSRTDLSSLIICAAQRYVLFSLQQMPLVMALSKWQSTRSQNFRLSIHTVTFQLTLQSPTQAANTAKSHSEITVSCLCIWSKAVPNNHLMFTWKT